jgi:hypothetical protein
VNFLAGAESTKPIDKARSSGASVKPTSVASKSAVLDGTDEAEGDLLPVQPSPPAQTESQKLVKLLLVGDQIEVRL